MGNGAPNQSFARTLLGAIWQLMRLAAALVGVGFLGLVVIVVLNLGRCVLEGTLVDTPAGRVPVEQLRIGDAVWTRTAEGSVQRGYVVAHERSRVLRHRILRFADGTRLAITGSHPIATSPQAFTPAESLGVGDEVVSRSGRPELVSVEMVYGLANVHDITVEPGQSFFAGGVLVHNKSIAAYESGTIGDIRSVVSAQSAYQSANQGYYDGRLECLAAPAACLPEYPEDGPHFLDEETASLRTRRRYAREFVPGTPAETFLGGISPSSVSTFAYLAIPVEVADGTRRAFCGDSSGRICFTPNGERPLVKDAGCVVVGDDGAPEVVEATFFERWFGDSPRGPRPCNVIQ